MPANRKLRPKFKPHIGRIFKLRNYASIPAYNQSTAGYTQKQMFLDKNTELGEAVMVFDETNTRVCVLKNEGTPVWIQKYFLLEEVTPEKNADSGKEALAELCSINVKLRENKTLTNEDYEKFERALNVVRLLLDKVN